MINIDYNYVMRMLFYRTLEKKACLCTYMYAPTSPRGQGWGRDNIRLEGRIDFWCEMFVACYRLQCVSSYVHYDVMTTTFLCCRIINLELQ